MVLFDPLPKAKDKTFAIIGLLLDLFWPGAGMFLVGFTDESKTNPKYHIIGIILVIVCIVCGVLCVIPVLGWGLYLIIRLVLMIICLINNIAIMGAAS
jgi:hypothetical protein